MRDPHHGPEMQQRLLDFITQVSPEANALSMHVGALMLRVAHAFYRLNECGLAGAGISFAQFRLLTELLFSEQILACPGLNPSTISERRGVSRNTVSALVSSLEEQGLVQRRLDANDRRRFIIELTDHGRALARRHASDHYQMMSSFFDALTSEEKMTLIQLLDKLADDPRLTPQGA
jgi:DNA-binding MarR family transcriptional regulator